MGLAGRCASSGDSHACWLCTRALLSFAQGLLQSDLNGIVSRASALADLAGGLDRPRLWDGPEPEAGARCMEPAGWLGPRERPKPPLPGARQGNSLVACPLLSLNVAAIETFACSFGSQVEFSGLIVGRSSSSSK